MTAILWSASPAESVEELERALVYLGGAAAAISLARRERAPQLLTGVGGGALVVCLYALATRLFPERLGSYDPLAGYRLSAPIGYWNALGIFCALGALLAVGLAARAQSRAARALAAASLVVLVTAQYFTFSRGAWLALGAGALALVVLDRRRLQFLASAFALAPWLAASVWLASRSNEPDSFFIPVPSAPTR